VKLADSPETILAHRDLDHYIWMKVSQDLTFMQHLLQGDPCRFSIDRSSTKFADFRDYLMKISSSLAIRVGLVVTPLPENRVRGSHDLIHIGRVYKYSHIITS
jgi:hypothetical protein